MYRQREAAVPVKPPTNPFEALFAPPKPRGDAEQALAAAAVRHEAEYYVPIEHHNPMELYASTVIYEATASSRSTTRRKACRTSSAICAACSA